MQYAQFEKIVGKRLLHSITDARGLLLIPEDTILSEKHIEKLTNFKIDVFDILVADVNAGAGAIAAQTAAAIPSPARAESADSTDLVNKSIAGLQEIERFVQSNGTVPIADLEEKVLPIIMEAARKRNLFQLFADLKSMADFRYKQSIGVVALSAMLGKWLKLDEKELSLLTTAACLYDIGLVKLPSYLLNKPERFQPSEAAIMKEHSVLGHEILKESGVDPRVALVALQHHEREDGSGYPHGLTGDKIDRLSKIIALADVYVAATSERPYRAALSFYEVIHDLHAGIVAGRFDSSIGLTLLNKLMEAQVGSEVSLSDGRIGKILLINPNYPTSPLVSVGDQCLDLSKDVSVKIKEIVG